MAGDHIRLDIGGDEAKKHGSVGYLSEAETGDRSGLSDEPPGYSGDLGKCEVSPGIGKRAILDVEIADPKRSVYPPLHALLPLERG